MRYILSLIIVLSSLSVSFGDGYNKQTYINRSGTVVARSYTNNGITTYRNSQGQVLGYSKQNQAGATKIVGSDGSYVGIIANGLIRNNQGRVIGNVKSKK